MAVAESGFGKHLTHFRDRPEPPMVFECSFHSAAIRKGEVYVEAAVGRNRIEPSLFPMVLEPFFALHDGAFVSVFFRLTSSAAHHVHHQDALVLHVRPSNFEVLDHFFSSLEYPERKVLRGQHVDFRLVPFADILFEDCHAAFLGLLQAAEIVLRSPRQGFGTQVYADRSSFAMRFHPLATNGIRTTEIFAKGQWFSLVLFAKRLFEELDFVVSILTDCW